LGSDGAVSYQFFSHSLPRAISNPAALICWVTDASF
jgi:hypothetical protein